MTDNTVTGQTEASAGGSEFDLKVTRRGCDRCGCDIPFLGSLAKGWVNDETYDVCGSCWVEMQR